MSTDYAASFDNIRVIPKAYLVDRQCTLDPIQLIQAGRALREVVYCWPRPPLAIFSGHAKLAVVFNRRRPVHLRRSRGTSSAVSRNVCPVAGVSTNRRDR